MGDDAAPRWRPLFLLWLCGIALRLTILAVPPVLPMIRNDFGLSATEVGVLGSVAPALFAVAAMGGSLLVARIGVRGALLGGLLTLAVGTALRGVAFDFSALLGASVVMCAGVAMMQPIMPTTVRHWLTLRDIGLGTAIYTNGLLVGEVIPMVLTLPVLYPLLGGWRATLASWAVPILLIALAVYVGAPQLPGGHRAAPGATRKWMPDWHSGLLWRLGVLFACVNSIYFGTNAFIPVHLTSQDHPELISGALTALNFGQIPASLLLLLFARKLERRMWPYVLSGVLSLVSLGGLVFAVGPMTWFWAGLLGFSDSAALISGLTLPARLCKPEDVARTSAGVFTLSYGSAVVIAVIAGALWDATGVPGFVYLPFAACAVVLAATAVALRAKRELA